MQLHLYRPILWWCAGRWCVVDSTTDLAPDDAAQLLRLKWAALPDIFSFIPGDSMSDDYSSALRLVLPPLAEPLVLSQAKAFLRIEHTADDNTLSGAIVAARQCAEDYLRFALLPQTWEYVVANPCAAKLRLPVGPAQSISSVVLTNEAGASTTMHSANYRLSVDGCSVLFTQVPVIEKLAVQFVAGAYADASAVPMPIVQGMLHHIAVMVEHRDGAAAMPVQTMGCYQPYRRVAL